MELKTQYNVIKIVLLHQVFSSYSNLSFSIKKKQIMLQIWNSSNGIFSFFPWKFKLSSIQSKTI